MKRISREHTVLGNKRYAVFDPVIEIDSGETIVMETINHMMPVVRSEADLHRYRVLSLRACLKS